jgi:hypothetical protein
MSDWSTIFCDTKSARDSSSEILYHVHSNIPAMSQLTRLIWWEILGDHFDTLRPSILISSVTLESQSHKLYSWIASREKKTL